MKPIDVTRRITSIYGTPDFQSKWGVSFTFCLAQTKQKRVQWGTGTYIDIYTGLFDKIFQIAQKRIYTGPFCY